MRGPAENTELAATELATESKEDKELLTTTPINDTCECKGT